MRYSALIPRGRRPSSFSGGSGRSSGPTKAQLRDEAIEKYRLAMTIDANWFYQRFDSKVDRALEAGELGAAAGAVYRHGIRDVGDTKAGVQQIATHAGWCLDTIRDAQRETARAQRAATKAANKKRKADKKTKTKRSKTAAKAAKHESRAAKKADKKLRKSEDLAGNVVSSTTDSADPTTAANPFSQAPSPQDRVG